MCTSSDCSFWLLAAGSWLVVAGLLADDYPVSGLSLAALISSLSSQQPALFLRSSPQLSRPRGLLFLANRQPPTANSQKPIAKTMIRS
jgi:hypothetical protein